MEADITLIERPLADGLLRRFLLVLLGAAVALCAVTSVMNFRAPWPQQIIILLQQIILLYLIALAFRPVLATLGLATGHRLHIGRDGIRFEPGRVLGTSFLPGWSMEAAAIGQVYIQLHRFPAPPAAAVLRYYPRQELNLASWLAEGEEDWLPAHPLPTQVHQRIEQSPLIRALRAMGYRVHVIPEPHSPALFLVAQPCGKLVFGLLAALFFYDALEIALGTQAYVDFQPYPWVALVAVAGLFYARALLNKTELPRSLKSLTAVLFAMALGAAVYFAPLRINEIDAGPAEEHIYRLIRFQKYPLGYCAVLEGETPYSPRLEFVDLLLYFSRRDIGSRYRFEFRRGILGFRQLRFDPTNQGNPAPVAMDAEQ